MNDTTGCRWPARSLIALGMLAWLAALGGCPDDGGPAESPAADAATTDGGADAAQDVPGGDTGPGAGDAATPMPDTAAPDVEDAEGTGDTATPNDAAAADAPEPPESWTQPVADGPWEWLAHHDGAAAGALQHDAPVQVYEYTRFEVYQPFRLRAVRVQVEVAEPTTLAVHVWDDNGGNHLSLLPEPSLAVLEREVTATDSGQWLELPIEPALVVDPGRLFYVGVVVDDTGPAPSPRLRVDAAPSPTERPVARSIVWDSLAIAPDSGAHTVFFLASGDFMVEVELQRMDVVQGDAFYFEPMDPAESGLSGMSRGGFDDFDGDGDLDLMTSGPRLLVGDGAGHFVDASADVLPEGVSAGGGVWGDFDNDGDPDWFGTALADVLLRNDGGVFVDVTAASGIDDTQQHTCNGVSAVQHVPTESAAWLDYDGDGWLDLYQGNFICWDDGLASLDYLYRNNGDGTFTNVSAETGLLSYQGAGLASRGMAPADANGDGMMDLLVTNYRLNRNLMWLNQGDGTFVDVAKASTLAGVGVMSQSVVYYGHSIGAAWGDFDLDGDLDVLIANLAHPRFLEFSDKAKLYANVSTAGGAALAFDDITAAAGFRYQETASDPTAWDFDNDGDLDLTWTCIYESRPSQFYRNDWPAAAWKEVSYPSGMVTWNGWGSAAGDVDLDGDLDYVAQGAFRNRNPWGNNALQIRPRGLGAGATNVSGYGARVRVTYDGVTRLQEHGGSHGTSSQSSPWLHFGLRHHEAADVVVSFPLSGTELTFPALAAGRYTVVEDGTLISDP